MSVLIYNTLEGVFQYSIKTMKYFKNKMLTFRLPFYGKKQGDKSGLWWEINAIFVTDVQTRNIMK